MAGNDKAASIQACAMRVSRLDANGATPAGSNNMIVTAGLIKLDQKTVLESGEEFTLKNGCGAIGYTYKDDDKFKRLDLGVTFIRPDPEMNELMGGASLITSGGQSIGWSAPAVGADSGNGVCLEVWSKAWIGGGQAAAKTFTDAVTTSASTTLTSGTAAFTTADVGRTITGTGIPAATTILTYTSPTSVVLSAAATATATGVTIVIGRGGRYFRWVYPKLKATLGDFALENAATQALFNGPAYENPGIGNGPNNDWPTGIVAERTYSAFRDDTLPSLTTEGYQATPAQV